jgi:hypothetical protein
VTMRVTGDANSLWNLLGDMTNIAWMPPTRRVECEGSGPGLRRIYGSTDTPVVERWISVNPERREIVYQIEENNPLPADPYIVTSNIEVVDSESCLIRWTVDFDSNDRDAVVRGIETVYPMIAGWLEDAVAQSGPPDPARTP